MNIQLASPKVAIGAYKFSTYIYIYIYQSVGIQIHTDTHIDTDTDTDTHRHGHTHTHTHTHTHAHAHTHIFNSSSNRRSLSRSLSLPLSLSVAPLPSPLPFQPFLYCYSRKTACSNTKYRFKECTTRAGLRLDRDTPAWTRRHGETNGHESRRYLVLSLWHITRQERDTQHTSHTFHALVHRFQFRVAPSSPCSHFSILKKLLTFRKETSRCNKRS